MILSSLTVVAFPAEMVSWSAFLSLPLKHTKDDFDLDFVRFFLTWTLGEAVTKVSENFTSLSSV